MHMFSLEQKPSRKWHGRPPHIYSLQPTSSAPLLPDSRHHSTHTAKGYWYRANQHNHRFDYFLAWRPYFSSMYASHPRSSTGTPFLNPPRASRIALRARKASKGSGITIRNTSPSSIRMVLPARMLYFRRSTAGREIVPLLVTVMVYIYLVICPIITSSR